MKPSERGARKILKDLTGGVSWIELGRGLVAKRIGGRKSWASKAGWFGILACGTGERGGRVCWRTPQGSVALRHLDSPKRGHQHLARTQRVRAVPGRDQREEESKNKIL